MNWVMTLIRRNTSKSKLSTEAMLSSKAKFFTSTVGVFPDIDLKLKDYLQQLCMVNRD